MSEAGLKPSPLICQSDNVPMSQPGAPNEVEKDKLVKTRYISDSLLILKSTDQYHRI